MDHRLFKAASTTSAEAVTGIGPKGDFEKSKVNSLFNSRQGDEKVSFGVIFITGLGISIAEAEEGASTEIAGTAAADAHLLDLFDRSDAGGPRVKGDHLDNSTKNQLTEK